jgi:hypothetical protein
MCQHDTSTEHSKQSAAPAPNHPSGHTAAENAKTVKGTAMDPLDEILKQIDLINKQIQIISEILRISDIVENIENLEPAENAEPDAG